MHITGLIMSVLVAAVEPLTADQRIRLQTAYEGRDHQEEAFVALLENIEAWTPGLGDAALRLHPDLEAMMAEPDAFRGDLCRVTGTIQQQTPLGRPYTGVAEWFLRDEEERPFLVFVTDRGLAKSSGKVFADGNRVRIVARFYKRVDALARDGTVHMYPAFVGRFPRSLMAADAAWGGLWAVAGPVAVMLVVFAILLGYARRGGRSRPHRVPVAGEFPVQVHQRLPDDPAEALAELRRRAEACD